MGGFNPHCSSNCMLASIAAGMWHRHKRHNNAPAAFCWLLHESLLRLALTTSAAARRGGCREPVKGLLLLLRLLLATADLDCIDACMIACCVGCGAVVAGERTQIRCKQRSFRASDAGKLGVDQVTENRSEWIP